MKGRVDHKRFVFPSFATDMELIPLMQLLQQSCIPQEAQRLIQMLPGHQARWTCRPYNDCFHTVVQHFLKQFLLRKEPPKVRQRRQSQSTANVFNSYSLVGGKNGTRRYCLDILKLFFCMPEGEVQVFDFIQ